MFFTPPLGALYLFDQGLSFTRRNDPLICIYMSYLLLHYYFNFTIAVKANRYKSYDFGGNG